MKAEMWIYGIGAEDPKRFSRLIQTLQSANYDCAKILSAFADIEDTKRLRGEVDHDRQNLEARLEECRETLPFADQLLRAGITIGEVLALHSVVYEKAEMERIPLDTAAYKVVEDLKLYSQFSSLQKSIQQAQQQLVMLNIIMTTRQQALVSLMRLQALGVTDMEIKNMARLMDFDSILEKKSNNGNTKNGWPIF
jgi:hypothetical protein